MVNLLNAHGNFQFKLSHGQAYIMKFDNYYSKGKFKPHTLFQSSIDKNLEEMKNSNIMVNGEIFGS